MLAYFFRDILFLQTTSVIHDSLKIYPFFHYLIQNIQNDVLPLWSPHGHSGEPFWPYVLFTGLLQPMTLLTVLVAWVTQTDNVALLYHWFLFLTLMAFNWGTVAVVDWLFRKSPHRQALHWVLSPILFFGTLSTVVWAQAFGTILVAAYYPLAVYFLCRTLDHLKKSETRAAYRMATFLVVTISIHMTSYNPAFFCFALSFQGAALVLKGWLDSNERHRFGLQVIKVGTFGMLLTVLFSAPTWMLAERQSLLAPVARQEDTHFYSKSATYNAGFGAANNRIDGDLGDSAVIGDIFQSVQGSRIWEHKEIPLLLGVFGFLLAVIGLLRFGNPIQFTFGGPLLFFALLALGSKAGVSTLVYNSVPGFTLARHLQFFLSYAFFGAVIMAGLGAERIIRQLELRFPNRRTLFAAVTFVFALSFVSSVVQFRQNKTTHLQPAPEILTSRFAYLGKTFSWRRRFLVEPIQPFAFYRDHTRSQGEPFLMYSDSVRFLGRQGPKFFAPLDYWSGLNKDVFSLDQLGVSADKLRWLGAGGDIALLDYSPNILKVRLKTADYQTLFYSQNQFPGWKAKIDGNAVSIPKLTAHPFFELTIPPGTHVLELTYQPDKFLYCLGLYFCGLAVAAALALRLDEAFLTAQAKQRRKQKLRPHYANRTA